MTAESHNLEAMDLASSFGLAVLGTLEYDDHEQNWLLEFGYAVADYEYLRTYRERDLKSQAHLDGFIERINNISDRYIGFRIQGHIQITDCIAQIRSFVKAMRREKSYALFLIAGCSWYISKSHGLTSELDSKHSSQLKATAQFHLKELASGCSTIGINQAVLWAKLDQKLSKCGTIYDVRDLLQELSRPLKVLLISADPKNTTPVCTDQERGGLSKVLRETDFRHKVKVEDIYGCRVDDIHHTLNHHKPDILQFLGHGDETGLYFEDKDKEPELVSMTAFADVLKQYNTIKLVILNTCFSQTQGQCIADAVGSLIGMEGKIRNSDAIAFTERFYTGLGDGYTIEKSFDQASAFIRLKKKAKCQAHLLRKGLPSHTIVPTRQPAGGAWNDYRGPSTGATQWPLILAIILCVLATTVYFRNVCGSPGNTVDPGPGLWNSSGDLISLVQR